TRAARTRPRRRRRTSALRSAVASRSMSAPRLAEPDVVCTPREGGGVVLASAIPLGAYPRSVPAMLVDAAAAAPARTFLAEREPGGRWREVTYAEALDAARAIGAALL